jgi:hypothetical protein
MRADRSRSGFSAELDRYGQVREVISGQSRSCGMITGFWAGSFLGHGVGDFD